MFGALNAPGGAWQPVDPLTSDVGKIDASRQFEAIRRRWKLVVLIVLLCVGIAGVTTSVLPRTYQSTTTLLVEAVPSLTDTTVANSRTQGELNLDTEAQIVRSVALADAVAAIIESDLPARDIAEAVSVTVPANSQVLAITFEASTAESAQAGASAYADAYLEQRRAGSANAIEESTATITAQLASLQEQLATETARSGDKALSEIDRTIAASRRDALVGQISTLNSTLAQLSRTTVTPGSVLSVANLPSSPTSPSLVINLAVGLVLGLIIGLGSAVVIGYFDHRVRYPGDIRVSRNVRVHGELLTGASSPDDVNHQVDEEVDQLRIDIDSSGPGEPQAILVAPVGPNSGAEFIALSLGRAYARRLGSAIYAITDTAGTAQRALGIDGPGLAELLMGDGGVPVAIDDSGLAAIGPGNHPEQLSGLLQRPRALDQIREAGDDMLILATASVHQSAASQSLLGEVDRVLLIGRSGMVDDRDLARAIESIERSKFNGPVTVALVAPKRTKRSEKSVPATEKSKPATQKPDPAPEELEPAIEELEPAIEEPEPATEEPEPATEELEPATEEPERAIEQSADGKD